MKEKLYLILGSIGIGLASLAITLTIYNVKIAKTPKIDYEVVKVDESNDTEIKIDERLTEAQKEVAKNLIAKLDEISKNDNSIKENSDEKINELEEIDNTQIINVENEKEDNSKSLEVVETFAKSNKDDSFLLPAAGEIGLGFSDDKLVFSSTLEEWIVHNGIDILNDKGTLVYATKDGKIEKMYEDIKYGYTIIISHDEGYVTKYSGIDKNDDLKVGDSVKRGDLLSKISEPRGFEMDEGSHLHFEVLKDGVNIKPEFGG